jgi:hypothetical protein
MQSSPLVIVVLAVGDTSATAGHLDISPLHRLDVAHVVLVRELARDNVAEDFKLAVRVGGETSAGLLRVRQHRAACHRPLNVVLTATLSSLITRR